MTRTDDRSAERKITWARVDEDFYVGSTEGDFVGYIDRRDGVFVASDMYSRHVGSFADLESAMTALTNEGGGAAS